ncbi:MAG: hypothetical protein ACLP7P_02155 [Rhodomicrobium sp.]
MLKWLGLNSDKFTAEELERLKSLTLELATDYGTPDLPVEFEKVVAQKNIEIPRFWSELANSAQIASFIYQVARDAIPVIRDLVRAKMNKPSVIEVKAIEAAETSVLQPTDTPAIAMKKRGLVRRVVAGLLPKE